MVNLLSLLYNSNSADGGSGSSLFLVHSRRPGTDVSECFYTKKRERHGCLELEESLGIVRVLRHFGTRHFADDPLLTPQHFDTLTF